MILILDCSYGLRRYMDEGMLQPDGRVIFPIKLPKTEIITNSKAMEVSATLRAMTILRKWDPNTTWGIMNGWFSVVRNALIPIGLGLVVVFAQEAISILRPSGRR